MRSFYTALGHFVSAYEDANYLQHLRGGIEWVIGGGAGS
jgi:type 1 glutamine amidotransferase